MARICKMKSLWQYSSFTYYFSKYPDKRENLCNYCVCIYLNMPYNVFIFFNYYWGDQEQVSRGNRLYIVPKSNSTGEVWQKLFHMNYFITYAGHFYKLRTLFRNWSLITQLILFSQAVMTTCGQQTACIKTENMLSYVFIIFTLNSLNFIFIFQVYCCV